MIAHWLYTHLGLDSANSPYYLFFSGPAIVVSVFWHGFVRGWSSYRAHNCHVARCWRYARQATAGGHRVCWKHHPADAPSAQQVAAAHEAALAGTLTRKAAA